jgi:hypothetical protein
MSGGSIAIVILFSVFVWGVVTVIRTLQDHHTIRQLAESGTPAEVVRALRTLPADLHLSTLRAAFVAIAAGAALLLIQFLPLDRNDPAAWGIVLIAIGAALLWYERMLPNRLRRLTRDLEDT